MSAIVCTWKGIVYLYDRACTLVVRPAYFQQDMLLNNYF